MSIHYAPGSANDSNAPWNDDGLTHCEECDVTLADSDNKMKYGNGVVCETCAERIGYQLCETKKCSHWVERPKKPSHRQNDDGDLYCEDCYSHLYCECGQLLKDAYGQPGDGFCARCR